MSISKSPWERRDRSVYDANDRLVAMCFGGSADEAEENAQLASVAPEMLGKIKHLEAEKAEMLAILEEVRESSTCCGTYDLLDETTWASPDLADGIEAAIRKARGGE